MKTVVVLGGKGSLSEHYRKAVEGQGYELRHFENKVPKSRKTLGKVALVVVMVSMVSHALAAHARDLASEGGSVVYLKSPSASALRSAVAENA